MLSKLKLLNSDQYQLKVVVEYITKMLVDFVQGKSHYLEVGSEQDTIDKWDDLVIISSNGEYIYIQIKRQTTSFSADSIIRGDITKGKNKGNPKELSEFDKVFESFGRWVFSNSLCKRKFRLILPGFSIKVKKELEIRHLTEFKNQIRRGITTKEGLEALIESDTASKNIFSWLTTWCGFTDEDHIIKAFNLLEFEMQGLELDIEKRIKDNLKNIFMDSESENIYLKLLSYVQENIVFTGSIKPRQLLYLLQKDLRPEIKRWTLFKTNGSNWTISGIQDLKDNSEIERPAVIVPSFWVKGNPYSRKLMIYGNCLEKCPVSESLMRLFAHPQGSFDIFCLNKSSWDSSIKNKTGGTLGVSKHDFDDLRTLDELEYISPSESKQLNTISETKRFAKELDDEMYKITFQLIDTAIFNAFRDMSDGKLVEELECRWTFWKQSLEKNIDEQKELFVKILHPNAEGKSICGEMRVGSKTVELLSDALVLLLVVSVCLADADNQDWKSVKDKLKMTSIGLAYWSGPADSSKNIIKIDDNEGIGNLLEYEPSQIIIISQSELTDLEIFKDDISSDLTKLTLLTHPKYPKLLITKDRNFKCLLDKGDISDLKEYFQKRIDTYEEIIEDAINNVVEGL